MAVLFRVAENAPWEPSFTPLTVEERAYVNRTVGWEMYRSVD